MSKNIPEMVMRRRTRKFEVLCNEMKLAFYWGNEHTNWHTKYNVDIVYPAICILYKYTFTFSAHVLNCSATGLSHYIFFSLLAALAFVGKAEK